MRPREGSKAGSNQAPRANGASSDNPNGWDPIFDGSIVSGNDFLAENNVTYQDLINKPIQFKILVQGNIFYNKSANIKRLIRWSSPGIMCRLVMAWMI